MPSSRPAAGTAAPTLPATLRLGAVHLTVTDLDRAIEFYERSIGLSVRERSDRGAGLGVGGEDLLVLHEQRGARRAGRHSGLYHFALLHPSREELARAALRLAATQTPITGASDHGISEAIYLSDPDGNGIELYADRPRERWPDLSDPAWVANGPDPLDLTGLLALVDEEAPRPQADPRLVVGHVHLHVGDTRRATGFYRDVLGFEVQTDIGVAVFASAGGYHHHVAYNVWRGDGVDPVPEGTVGLRHWTIVLDGAAQVAEVRARVEAAGRPAEDRDGDGFLTRDPDGIAVAFTR